MVQGGSSAMKSMLSDVGGTTGCKIHGSPIGCTCWLKLRRLQGELAGYMQQRESGSVPTLASTSDKATDSAIFIAFSACQATVHVRLLWTVQGFPSPTGSPAMPTTTGCVVSRVASAEVDRRRRRSHSMGCTWALAGARRHNVINGRRVGTRVNQCLADGGKR